MVNGGNGPIVSGEDHRLWTLGLWQRWRETLKLGFRQCGAVRHRNYCQQKVKLTWEEELAQGQARRWPPQGWVALGGAKL